MYINIESGSDLPSMRKRLFSWSTGLSPTTSVSDIILVKGAETKFKKMTSGTRDSRRDVNTKPQNKNTSVSTAECRKGKTESADGDTAKYSPVHNDFLKLNFTYSS